MSSILWCADSSWCLCQNQSLEDYCFWSWRLVAQLHRSVNTKRLETYGMYSLPPPTPPHPTPITSLSLFNRLINVNCCFTTSCTCFRTLPCYTNTLYTGWRLKEGSDKLFISRCTCIHVLPVTCQGLIRLIAISRHFWWFYRLGGFIYNNTCSFILLKFVLLSEITIKIFWRSFNVTSEYQK